MLVTAVSNDEIASLKEHSSEDISIEYCGLAIRLKDYDAASRLKIRTRFGDFSSNFISADEIPISVRISSCAYKSMDNFSNENMDYQLLLSHTQESVSIEGYNFFGEIQLEPSIKGEISANNINDLSTPNAYENFLRVITAYAMMSKGGLFMHSAVVVVDGFSYMFIGRSNAGKTTISRKALAIPRAQVLSDDANILYLDEKQEYITSPVPFAGELGQTGSTNSGRFPLKGLFWIEKSDHNQLVEIQKAQQFAKMLVCSTTLNADPYRLDILSERIEHILDQVPLKVLQFTKESSFEDLYKLIRVEK